MSIVRVNYLPEFYLGDDAVLLTLDGGGVDTMKAAVVEARNNRSARVLHDGVVQEFYIEPGAATVELTPARVVWRFDDAKAAEIANDLASLSAPRRNGTTAGHFLTITSALLHRTPIRFIRAFTGTAKVSSPLLLQYPLYGGLIGLLGYQATKDIKPLQTLLAEALVHGASEYTLPFITFVGSVIISLFVPSGGGHWAVQGPVAVGEWVANMIQPFWLLPLLAIAKLNVRQVMGFTIVAFLIGFVVLGATMLIAPHVI